MFKYQLLPLYAAIVIAIGSYVYFHESPSSPGTGYFNNCGSAQYYNGHGIEALNTSTLNDYLSAINLDNSYFCFGFGEDKEGFHEGIGIVWYSSEKLPEHIIIYGINCNAFGCTEEPLIDLFPRESYLDLNNVFAYSIVSLPSPKRYNNYKIKLIGSDQSERLLIRSLVPYKTIELEQPYKYLLDLAYEVSISMEYGGGFNKLPKSIIEEGSVLSEYLETQKKGHCGNYALAYINKLNGDYSWKYYGLRTPDGLEHAVVEVQIKGLGDAGVVTIDPTFGILYACDVSSMLNDTCNYSSMAYIRSYNPAGVNFIGQGFYSKAFVLYKKSLIQEVFNSYIRH